MPVQSQFKHTFSSAQASSGPSGGLTASLSAAFRSFLTLLAKFSGEEFLSDSDEDISCTGPERSRDGRDYMSISNKLVTSIHRLLTFVSASCFLDSDPFLKILSCKVCGDGVKAFARICSLSSIDVFRTPTTLLSSVTAAVK